MKILEDRIRKDGRILPGDVVKVDSFLNHLIDVRLAEECAKEWHSLYADCGVTKILTIESSGIGIACITAQQFGVPMLYAKKMRTTGSRTDMLVSKVTSYTHGHTYDVVVNASFIDKDDRILIIDDFLANGSALEALISIVKQAGATVVGAGIAIEKVYQGGGNRIRERGCRVEALARISSIDPNEGIKFC